MWLTILSGAVSLLLGLYRQFWSDSAMLKRLELKSAELQARQQVEAERLKATYSRIEAEPDLHGQALADKLTETVKKVRRDGGS